MGSSPTEQRSTACSPSLWPTATRASTASSSRSPGRSGFCRDPTVVLAGWAPSLPGEPLFSHERTSMNLRSLLHTTAPALLLGALIYAWARPRAATDTAPSMGAPAGGEVSPFEIDGTRIQ